ncbi:MAG: winged helix-turn-helix transcriptional regulator [Clostridiales bacterium]|nr:winged helix-turn-helix transcriptional regulator [Clostridiales bacterium]
MNHFKMEWSLSLLNKYSSVYMENKFKSPKLSKTQLLFIIHLRHRPMIHQERLAEMFKMNRSTVTRGIDQLVSFGYVDKTIDKDNKRANLLILTEIGVLLYEDIMETVYEWTNIITEDMTESEKKMSISLLTKMAGNACKHAGDDKLARLLQGE